MNSTALMDWAVAARPMTGEVESGDLFTVKPVGSGMLVAVVDGLGHGPEAAAAARAAVAVLDRYDREPLVELVTRCHAALNGTRGVVMSLAFFDGATDSLTWLGVGNVEGVILYRGADSGRPRASLVAPGGILGSALPRLQTQVYPFAPGTTLVFASDGIRSGFSDQLLIDASAQQIADQILARYAKDTDDALVLVVRYGAASSGVAR
jgi:negative regulator of sigma-B (phosphoserine phosphatase)